MHRITHIYLVPTMMSRLLKLPADVKARYDVSCVEYCVSTGSPWPHDLKAAMIDWWGPVFWESYGATEIGFMTMASSEDAMTKPGTAGRPQMGCTILILDSDGNKLPAENVGEIHARMDAFGGFDYSNDPDSRAAGEKHSHFSVGDLGWLDEDGDPFITDRKKDMIISGGANISGGNRSCADAGALRKGCSGVRCAGPGIGGTDRCGNRVYPTAGRPARRK